MNWLHIVLGIALFIVFLITGQYMRGDFPDKELIPQDLRLLMRSRHIYILFSAMLHLMLGAYLQMRPQRWRRILQILGSFLLVLGSVFLVWAFITETYYTRHFSELSRYGIYTSAIGVLLHTLARILLKSKLSRSLENGE